MNNVRMQNTGQLLVLQQRLRAAGGPRLQQNFNRRIRRAAEPLRDDLKSAIRSLEIGSPGRRGRGGPSPTTRPLRATIADAIRISVHSGGGLGARVWIDRGALPRDLRNMPKVLNEGPPPGRVRHPVFNNRRRWVNQTVRPYWWDDTVRRDTPRMRAEVARVVTDVRRDLGG